MNVVYINTQDKRVAKDMLIKAAIKLGFQYVEMENEVIIEYNYLFRFLEKEDVHLINQNVIDILSKNPLAENPYVLIDESSISFNKKDDFPKFKKNDYKLESKRLNSKIKTKINYNRRKY